MNKMSISFPSGGVLYISVKYLKQGGGAEMGSESRSIKYKKGRKRGRKNFVSRTEKSVVGKKTKNWKVNFPLQWNCSSFWGKHFRRKFDEEKTVMMKRWWFVSVRAEHRHNRPTLHPRLFFFVLILSEWVSVFVPLKMCRASSLQSSNICACHCWSCLTEGKSHLMVKCCLQPSMLTLGWIMFILWGTWKSEQNLMLIHPVVFIFY